MSKANVFSAFAGNLGSSIIIGHAVRLKQVRVQGRPCEARHHLPGITSNPFYLTPSYRPPSLLPYLPAFIPSYLPRHCVIHCAPEAIVWLFHFLLDSTYHMGHIYIYSEPIIGNPKVLGKGKYSS